VVVTTDADSSGNGTSCRTHQFILGTTLPKISLFTSFMSPMSPPASPGRVFEKGERLSDDALAFLVVTWTENLEFYLSKLRRSLRNSPSITLDDIDKLEATLIPKEHVYPLWREDITEVQTPLPLASS